MYRIHVAFSALVCLLAMSGCPALLAQAAPPPPDPGIALAPSMTDALAQDADGDGQISCGDQVTYVVNFGETTDSEDLDFLDVRLEIPVPTEVASIVPGTLVAFNPDDNPQATHSEDLIQVFMGRVCRTPTCNSPAAAISFRLEILDPNLFTSVHLAGDLSGSNFFPVDPAITTTFDSCAPQPLVSPKLTDQLKTDVDGDGLADPGDVLHFTHRVVNSPVAETDATNVAYTLPTSTGLEILPGTAQLSFGSLTSATSSDIRVFIPSLAPGQDSTLTFDARIDSPTSLLQTAAQFRVSGSNFTARLSDDPDTSSVFGDATRTLIDRDPDLALSLAVAPGIARPGETLGYTASVTNLGVPTASGVFLAFTVPPSTRLVPSASDPVTCSPDAGAGSTCEFSLGSVTSGDLVPRSFTLAIDSSVPPTFTGVVTTANVTDDGSQGPDANPTNNTATAEALADQVTLGPNLGIDKDDGGATATPGEVVAYDIHWSNLGNQDANGVVLEDVVPDHGTFEAASSTSGWSCTPDGSAGSICRISLGSVLVGDVGTVRFAVRVASQIPAGVVSVTNTASISHDGTANDDLDSSDNTDTEVTPLSASVGPDLQVTKTTLDSTAIPGETLTYELLLANRGSRGATGVRLVEAIPLHTSFVPSGSDARWSCATDSCVLEIASLPAGAQETIPFIVRVDPVLPAGITAIANSAVAQDDGENGPDLDPGDNEDTEEVPVDPSAAPDLEIQKIAQVASAVPGQLVPYRIVLANSGNRGATGVALTEIVPTHTSFDASSSHPSWDCPDSSPAGTVCTLTIPELSAGEQIQVDFAVRVSRTLPAGVSLISNTVQVDDDGQNGPDPDPGDDSDTEETPIDEEAAPDVSVDKIPQSLTAVPGDLLAYRVIFANDGTREATQVRLLETVPQHTTFVAAESAPDWSCADTAAGAPCELVIGSLPAGSSGEVLFTVLIDATLPAGVSSIDNLVSIEHDPGDGDDPNPDDNDDPTNTPIDPSAGPDLGITKTDLGLVVQPGELVTYQLRVTQTGTRGASGVAVTETLPDHAELVDPAQAPENAAWQCAGGGIAGDTCRLTLGELPVGADQTVPLVLRVSSSLPGDVTAVVNQARVDDDGQNGSDLDPSNNQAVEATPLDTTVDGGPDISVAKADGGTVIRPGEEVVYQVTVRNDGSQPASGVVVEETVPAHTVFLGALSSPGWSCAPGAPGGTPCRLEVPALRPGDVQVLRFAVRLPEGAAPDPARLTNTVTVADDGTNGPDLDPTNNTDAETTPVRLPDQGLDLVAILDDLITDDLDGDDLADVDDVITYVAQITNRSSETVTEVRFHAQPDPHSVLLGGSVFVDVEAQVLVGDQLRDGRVDVVLDRLEPGEVAEIVFQAQVEVLPTAVRHLSVQGAVAVAGLSLVTDDPMTAVADDPTRTPTDGAQIEPVDVPTLGFWALLALVAILGGLGAFFLRAHG